ncbi:peptidase [Megasphaera cerevisiae DSM 20462]|jgi:Zn-dependent protease|uniref:Peptidase n=1 Tax=Megasphaera cerevisiae DSM 20462 TaxID=1122219 RepID=A0A0J6WZN7_9FIRM|nr:site-2 protease family protein [Megasphaera cerevisiae]KMO87352.1 peptidase [Megasphaera cerevisiae DSM 20462]MCI1749933.1 site-2 protease family protein [Megasphaera cerevisiae]OKY54850.1 site-2 protease family protein [Megasphaera cerevisiae]SJZ39402.1 Zn-dependent protease (includes SpoIVFB) [Megasphaera cerevisiae DSM 20462]
MFNLNFLNIVAGIPGLLIALVIHEYAHALIADYMGDDTPRLSGRLTFNPISHIDPIGMLMLLVAQFGWAKPVMVNPNNFRNWRKGEICVSLAGPAANLIAAFIALVIQICLMKLHLFGTTALPEVLNLIVLYNVNFAIFNMIPLPPLDGSRVLMCFLPTEWNYKLASLERYSFLILIVLMATPFFTYILIPLQRLVFGFFSMILLPFL